MYPITYKHIYSLSLECIMNVLSAFSRTHLVMGHVLTR